MAHRVDPATGMNSWPQVTSRRRLPGSTKTRVPGHERDGEEGEAHPVEGRPAASDASRWIVGHAGRGPVDEDGEDEADHQVDREDHPPVGDGEDHRAVERADDAADLLDGRHDPERYAARSTG